MNKVLKLGLLSFVLCTSSQLINASSTGAYFGGGIGAGQLHSQTGLIQNDGNVLGGRVFFGYHLNPYLGLEVNYFALDETRYFDFDYPFISGNYSINGFSLVGKAYAPFSNESPFNLYALLGVAEVKGTFDVAYQSVSLLTFSDSGIVPTVGIGLSYDLNQRLTVGLECSVFGEKKSSDSLGIPTSSLATLNIAYKFNA